MYKIYDTTGSRKEYQKEYFERRGRLNTFAILYMLDGAKQYFGPERYSILCNSSSGHSVPIITRQVSLKDSITEEIYQKEGAQYSAQIIKCEATSLKDTLEIDLTKAYPDLNLESLIRSFEFEKESNSKLILKDTFKFKGKPLSVTERFITLIKPKYTNDDTVLIQGNKGAIEILFDNKNISSSIKEMKHTTHHDGDINVYAIDLTFNSVLFTSCCDITFLCRHDGEC